MIACGLPVVDVRTEANEINYQAGHVRITEPNAFDMMKAMADIILKPEKTKVLRKEIMRLNQNDTLENQNDTIEQILLNNG